MSSGGGGDDGRGGGTSYEPVEVVGILRSGMKLGGGMLPGGGGARGGGGSAIIGGRDLSTTANVAACPFGVGPSSKMDERADSIDCLRESVEERG